MSNAKRRYRRRRREQRLWVQCALARRRLLADGYVMVGELDGGFQVWRRAVAPALLLQNTWTGNTLAGSRRPRGTIP